MVAARGGKVRFNKWNEAGFCWNRKTGDLTVYLNYKQVDRQQTKYPDRDLQKDVYPYFQIGYKMDYNQHFYEGYIADLTVVKLW